MRRLFMQQAGEFIFPPVPFHEIERENAISGSPSTLVHKELLRLLLRYKRRGCDGAYRGLTKICSETPLTIY